MTIFIGNLNWNLAESEIQAMFEPFGEVKSVALIKDKMTKKSKGFAFVEMDDAEAQAAISELNGQDIKGRKLVVNEARPK
jgi:RNA recognition motif-containing protein